MISSTEPSTPNKIWNLLTPTERRSAVVLLGLMFIGMVLETLGVGLVMPAIGLLSQSNLARNYAMFQPVLQALGNLNQQGLVIGSMLVLVGVYLIKALFLALLAWWQMRFSFGVRAQISQRLFTGYLHQPYTFHLQRNSAQLIFNVINGVAMFVSNGILQGITFLTESLVLLGLCSLLLFVEPLGTLIVMGVLGTVAWSSHCLTRGRLTHWGEAVRYHEGLRIQCLQQGLGGAKDVKLLGRETGFLEQYRTHNEQSARFEQIQSTLQMLPRLWLELLVVIGLAILVISMVVQGRTLEAVLPTLGMFAVAAFRLMPSVNRLLSAMQSMRYGLAVIDNLYTELNLFTPEVAVTHSPVTVFHTILELNKITYTYPGAAEPTLKNITLAIQHSESVGFIGTSGAGKSTLVDILLGLLTPDSGQVKVDSQDIQNNLRNWQDQIGYVPQSIFLTDDTLRRNVAFGLPNEQIDDAAVQRAIQAAQLDGFVASLPDGLETLVGERGIRLSGGQRQRIGIARAIYHDPSVLVLDEATSSLDTAIDHEVMQAVRAMQGTKTIIIVAHRLSTIAHCDRLYQLDQGRLVKVVTPETLLANESII